MNSAILISETRSRSGLTLRELAARAGTSHSTLVAYEHGRKVPTAATLNRILEAAGFAVDVSVRPRYRSSQSGLQARGSELEAVLDLAGEFPARHAPLLQAPVFGR